MRVKMSQKNPTRTYCKRSRPLSYCNPNCRTPRHWKFTQHHRTTRPSPGWLVGWLFWVSLSFETVFKSILDRLSKRGRKRERTDESINVQTTPTRTYCKCNRPLLYYNPNCRTPGTGSLPSTIEPPDHWLVGCFGFNGPLRQYFSLYRTVSQREGERGEKR